MVSSYFVLLILSQILKPAVGLQVTPNSACAKLCIDDPTTDVSDPNSSSTNGSDIVCTDSAYVNTPTGLKSQSCINCLQNSTANSTNENDQEWFLYNIRYAFSTCIYNSIAASEAFSTPCSISTVCGPLAMILQADLADPSTTSQFSYCGANNETFGDNTFQACSACLDSNPDQIFLANQLVALQAGCIQRPMPSVLLGLDGSIFSSRLINITNPIILATPTKKKGLSTGAIAGIAAGGAVLLALIGALLFICYRRRRNRRNLGVRSSLDPRYGNKDIGNPVFGAFSHYNQPSPLTPASFENVGLIKVPPPIKTPQSYSKYDLPKYEGHYPSPPLPRLPQALRQTHEEMARDLGFSMGDQQPSPAPVESTMVPMLYQTSSSLPHSNYTPSEVSSMSSRGGTPVALGSASSTNRSPLLFTTSSDMPSRPVSSSTIFSDNIIAPGLPSLPKRSPNFSRQNTVLNPSFRNYPMRTTQDLSTSRGGDTYNGAGSNSPGQISGPIVKVTTRYEDEERDAKRRREKLYQEGFTKKKDNSPIAGDAAQDLW